MHWRQVGILSDVMNTHCRLTDAASSQQHSGVRLRSYARAAARRRGVFPAAREAVLSRPPTRCTLTPDKWLPSCLRPSPPRRRCASRRAAPVRASSGAGSLFYSFRSLPRRRRLPAATQPARRVVTATCTPCARVCGRVGCAGCGERCPRSARGACAGASAPLSARRAVAPAPLAARAVRFASRVAAPQAARCASQLPTILASWPRT
jgi:hypothetical protein